MNLNAQAVAVCFFLIKIWRIPESVPPFRRIAK